MVKSEKINKTCNGKLTKIFHILTIESFEIVVD